MHDTAISENWTGDRGRPKVALKALLKLLGWLESRNDNHHEHIEGVDPTLSAQPDPPGQSPRAVAHTARSQ